MKRFLEEWTKVTITALGLLIYGVAILVYFPFMIMFSLLYVNSPKRALDHLAKNPGPYTDANGHDFYVWLLNIEPRSDFDQGFWFELHEIPPPFGLEIKHERGHRSGLRLRSEQLPRAGRKTAHCYVFRTFVTKRMNLEMLRDYIRKDCNRPRHRSPVSAGSAECGWDREEPRPPCSGLGEAPPQP